MMSKASSQIKTQRLSKNTRVLAWALLSLILAVFYFATPYMGAASISYSCLVLGLVARKRPPFHVAFMVSGISIDILLVLFLEITRSAIGTATGDSLSLVQYIHIGSSLSAVLLYVPILYLGGNLFLRNERFRSKRNVHLRLGIVAFALRTVGWLTMFSFLSFNSY